MNKPDMPNLTILTNLPEMITIALALVDNECRAGKSEWKATQNHLPVR